jgi:hypothetical protein
MHLEQSAPVHPLTIELAIEIRRDKGAEEGLGCACGPQAA